MMEQYRQDFPMLKREMHGKPLIYLDSAATAQKPQAVIDRMTKFYEEEYATVQRAVYDLVEKSTEEYQKARRKVQEMIGAGLPEEIIFTRGTTESINLIAYSFGKAHFKPGDEILISEMEHHANIVPWQLLCEDRRTSLRVIPIDDQGRLNMQAFFKLLNPKTKLVSLTHISNALGTLNPIEEIITAAHANGSKVLIDGAQAAPHIPLDVKKLDVDFYVFSGHKLYGPTGIGALFGKKELLEAMPPYQGGGDMVDEVTFPKTTYQGLPLKFEAGTPMIAEAIGLGAACDYIQKVGLQNIQDYEESLTTFATQKIKDIPTIEILGKAEKKGSILSFISSKAHHLDIASLLNLRGVAIRSGNHCAQPTMRRFGVSGTLRASFAFYNTLNEIDLFLNHLEDVINKLK